MNRVLWVTAVALLASSSLMAWARRAGMTHYKVANGGACFGARRGAVACRGLAVGTLIGLLPVSLAYWLFGPLPSGGMQFVLGFLIGTTVYSQWFMRHWNALEACATVHDVRRRLSLLHVAAGTLGLLLIAVLLSIVWPTPSALTRSVQ